MASSSDNTAGGEFTGGDDGSLFGDPNVTGTTSDYASWNWKQIEAAILGGSMMSSSADEAQALSVSDPQTLWTAGLVFRDVMTYLGSVATDLQSLKRQMTGDGSAWQGDAAQAFSTMLNGFAGQVQATADVLAGGPSGLDSIPDQLYRNGNALSIAQFDIENIDLYYAQKAIAEGAPVMTDGLVQISSKPTLVQEMTAQMRQVLDTLVVNYQVTVDSIVPPQSVNNPVNNIGNLNGLDNLNNLGNLNGTGDLNGIGNLNGTGDLSGLGDPNSGAGVGADNLASLPNAAADGSLGTGGDGVSPADLSGISGADTGGGLGADTGVAADVLPNTGTGAGLGSVDGVSPADLSGLGGAAAGAGLGTGAGLGALDGVAAAGLPGLSTAAAGEGLGAAGGLGASEGVSPLTEGSGLSGLENTGLPAETGSAAAGEGYTSPMMPGGAGGLSGMGTASEPSDSSGLLGDEAKAWTGGETTAPEQEVGSLTGTSAGGAALTDGAGMPMMPGAGAAGAAGGQQGEVSDASGLLGGERTDWERAPGSEPEQEVGSSAGTSAGGAALTDGAGMPMMPGAGAAGAAGGQQGEASDASGLLGSEGTDWAPESEPDSEQEIGSASGTSAGGARLTEGDEPDDPGADDPSGWDTAGAVGDGLLLALGLWSRRRAESAESESVGETTVSTELPESWRPDRTSAPPPRRRLSHAAPEQPAEPETAAEPESGEPAEDGPEPEERSADLLVQEAGLWGADPLSRRSTTEEL